VVLNWPEDAGSLKSSHMFGHPGCLNVFIHHAQHTLFHRSGMQKEDPDWGLGWRMCTGLIGRP
jgi:hypothetical protein